MNSYTFYPGDYLRDTQHLSMLEHGAYRLLLDFYYSTERPLSANAKQLQSIAHAKTPHEKRALVFVLDHFFELGEDGFYHSGKADRELAKYADIKEKRKGAAMQMHSKRHANAPALALSPNPYPNPIKDKEVKNKPLKERYQDFVLLSPDEYKKLSEKLREKLEDYITRLNDYIENLEHAKKNSGVKKYASHYKTILNWAKRDGVSTTAEGTPAPASVPVRAGETEAEIIARVKAQRAADMAARATKKF